VSTQTGTKQPDEAELEELRKKILGSMEDARKRRAAKQLLSLILETFGYGILIYIDWRVALAVFLIQWAIQIKIVTRR
jgi:hypothetical protein